ncbi:MAG: hypothetical protein HY918_04520 [Candidatus Doudnabacteria bacterium]|nr:hypothetical protein [Candidatus Doudnabacteria bacterium]
MTKLEEAKRILDRRHQGQFWYLDVKVKEVVQRLNNEDLWYVVTECSTQHPNYTEDSLELFVLDGCGRICSPGKYHKGLGMEPEKLIALATVTVDRSDFLTSAGGGGSWRGSSSRFEVSYHTDDEGRFVFRARERPGKSFGLTVVTDKDVGSVVHDFELPLSGIGEKTVTVALVSTKKAVVETRGFGQEQVKKETVFLKSYPR